MKDRPLNPSYLRVVFLIFAHVRVKQHALTTFLLLHAHDASCSHFVLYIFIFFVNYADAEIVFICFPFEIQNILSADIVLVGNVLLINKSVKFFPQ